MKKNTVLLCALLSLLACPALFAATFNVTLEVYQQRGDNGDGYYAFPSLAVSPAPISYHHIESTHGWLNANSGTNNASGSLFFGTLQDFADELTNGLWTIILNTNTPSQEVYHFRCLLVNLNDTTFPAPSITFPGFGDDGVSNNPTFVFSGPADYTTLNVNVHDPDFSFYTGESLSPSETTWNAGQPLPDGTNQFSVEYVSNNAPYIVFTTPTNSAGQPLPGWSESVNLHTMRSTYFIVGNAAPANHTLVAHYAFDDSNNLGLDSSTQGNNITAGGQFGPQNHAFTSDSEVGAGAVQFFGDSYMAPPTNVLASLYGDFTVSVWVKTTQAPGADDDNIFNGAGIVWAEKFDSENDVVPLALTGNKAAFFTGSGMNGNEDTLYSSANINSGSYTHVAVTRSETSGQKKIYINGVLDNTSVGTSDLLNGPNELFDLLVGAGNVGLVGKLDDLQFYQGALSASDIANLFNNPGTTIPDSISGTLAGAVDATNLTWTTSGDADWFFETGLTHDAQDAAQSGDISDNQSSYIETQINGPATLSFWWRVSCEEDFDYLEVQMDGAFEGEITGDTGWLNYSFNIPTGTHTIRWTYFKDESGSEGDDAAYLDEVTVITSQPPSITRQPFDQTNSPGYDVVLWAEASGDPAPSYQWYKGGTIIPGATSAFYQPTNAGTAGVAGNYYVVANNSVGSAFSRTAIVSFVSAPLPPGYSVASKSPFSVNDFFYGSLVDSNGNIYAAAEYSGTNFVGSSNIITAGSRSAAIVKYSSSGTVLWIRAFTNLTHGNSTLFNLAPAPGGGVYAAGNFTGPTYLGTNVLTDAGNGDIFLGRFDANGSNIWLKTIFSTNNDFTSINCLVADTAGNVTLAGLLSASGNFGTTNLTVTNQQSFVAQYNASGTLRWAGLSSGLIQHLAQDGPKLYVSMLNNETNSYIGGITNSTSLRFTIAALDSNTGAGVWAYGAGADRSLGSPTGIIDDTPRLSALGTNLYVTGTAYGYGASFASSSGTLTLAWTNNALQYLVRYNTNGAALFAKSFGSDSTRPIAIAATTNGVYVNGDFDQWSSFDGEILGSPHGDIIFDGFKTDAFVAKFAPNGAVLWAKAAKTTNGIVNFRGLSAAPDGVWSSGFIKATADFDALELFSNFEIVGSPFGTTVWHHSGVVAKIQETLLSAPVTIMNANVTGANFSFQFQSVSGSNYTVEGRTNVATGTWTTVTNFTGDGTLKTVVVPANSPPARFFRVKTN